MGETITLAEGRLYVLVNPLDLNGRLTAFPTSARGVAPFNALLFVEGDEALLVDTSFSIHEASLVAQLDGLIPRSTRLAVLPPRLGEFDAVCNTRAVVDRFDVRVLYGGQFNGTHWVDFRPEHNPPGTGVGGGRMRDVRLHLLGSHDVIHVDDAGRRPLEVFHPVLRLLMTHWIHDPATRTLFTSDVFGHVWRTTADGPWIVTSPDDAPTSDELLDVLLGARFWWLAGARTQPLIDGLVEVFERYEVDVIVPSHGCALQGRDVVQRHVDVLLEALARAADLEPVAA
jgi:hypothetical protein